MYFDGSGEEIPAQPGAVAVRLSGGAAGLADVVRALDREEVRVANLRLDEPSLDDVFLAKTGRSLEGAGEDEEGGMEEVHAREVLDVPHRGPGDRAPLHGSYPEAACCHRPFSTLPDAVLLHRTRTVSTPPRKSPVFPTDSYLDFAFAFPLIQASLFGAITAGADLARDIESGFSTGSRSPLCVPWHCWEGC